MVHVRTVDISSWTHSNADPSLRQDCVKEFKNAMQELGMVVIVGHGIPAEEFNELFRASQQWFEQPQEKKLLFSKGPYGCPEGGYTPQGVEAVAASQDGQRAKDHVDPIESFVFRGEPNEFEIEFGTVSRKYYNHLCRLLHVLHQILCCGLNVPDRNHFCTQQIVSDDGHSLKFSYYPNQTQQTLRYGAHTDFQDITILKPDEKDWTQLAESSKSMTTLSKKVMTTGGLQVWDRHAEIWEPVILSDPDALCVNLGDFWNIWSHGLFVSPLHRVTGNWELEDSKAKPVPTKHTSARSSIIFFSVPKESALLEPLPGVTPSTGYGERLGDPSTHHFEQGRKPLTAGEHLAMKLARINS